MHPEAYQFVKAVTDPLSLRGKRVLEVGSYNVNGTVRPLFARTSHYTGLDVRDGPGVDVVRDIRDFDAEPFDVIVSCETLEHDADPLGMVRAMRKLLAPGGALILTCASPERAPHGVDGGSVGKEAYTPIEPRNLRAWLTGLTVDAFEHHPDRGDLYVLAHQAEARDAAQE